MNRTPRLRVLVVAQDQVGSRMAGAAIRAWEIARHLSEQFEVTLTTPRPTDLESDSFALAVAWPDDDKRLTALSRAHDVVVAQWLPVLTMTRLVNSSTRTVYDLYDPVMFEDLAVGGSKRPRELDLNRRARELQQQIALVTGDAFICATETQRDLWLGSLAALGRADRAEFLLDPSLRRLIDVVPFGLDERGPSSGTAIRGVVDGIGPNDDVILWGGGVWDWLDPITVIDAVARMSTRRPNVRLYFPGIVHPNPEVPAFEATARAIAFASHLGIQDRLVFFNQGWVPYAERGALLLDAAVGVSAHFDTVEARYAFRTRIVDYIWALLPVVATRGDVLADTLASRGGGWTVDFGDADAWATALDAALAPEARASAQTAMATLRAELEWPRAIKPLVRLILTPGPSRPAPAQLSRRWAEYMLTRLRLAQMHRGTGGATRQVLARVADHVRQ
jgi:glycosyltransferase involved in cell wall biosynthesis